MGFPDVNWPHYFAPTNDHAALETLVAELLEGQPPALPPDKGAIP